MKKSTAHWLKNVFSPSSSSSSSNSNSDDSIYVDRPTLKPSLFSRRRRKNSTRSYREPNQVREFDLKAENEPEWETICKRSPARSKSVSSGSPLPLPQPLPVPDLGSLLRRDTKFPCNRSNIDNVRLPSPRELQPREEKDWQKSEGQNGDVNYAQERLAIRESERNVEYPGNRPSMSSSPHLNGIGRISNDYRINFTSSESNSPYSSPLLSPQRCSNALTSQFVIPPSLFQVWSAPEMPSSDSVQYLGPSFQSPGDVTAYGVDNPPIQFRNSNGPASPLSNKLISENQIVCRDSNCPLPLPRAGGTPLQHISIPQLPAKSDLVPIKSRWQKGKLIGRGTFGSVYVASNKETGALCAMKEVEMLHDDPTSAECIRQLEQEIEVLRHLKHANIVQYFGSEIVGDRFHIYLEYVHPGSINNFIRDHCGAITESVVRNFTRHILSGLAYLHSKKTIHRDIKGANLLVDAYGVVKLADFGMAKHLTGQAANLSLKGSPYWMAPELLQSVMQKDDNVELAYAIDIWSLGCTIIEMLNGKPPWSEYEGPAALFKVLRESPSIPENLSAEGKDILRCCFCRNPAERPTAAKLLEHPFVRSPHIADTLSGSLDGMELTEKRNSQRTFLPHKLDQVILLSDMEVTKREIG